MAETSSVTWLLVVIAVATSLQTLMLIGAALMMLKAYRNVLGRVHALERQMLPLFDKAERALDAVEDATARLRTVDDKIRHTVAEGRELANRAMNRVKAEWWPAVATARAATAAVRAFRRRPAASQLRAVPGRAAAAIRQDEESRFDYEGGTHARS
jgi:hypothetical protein